ncbi:hypothetical protein ACFYOV_18445 [Streptomyces sp. NPDC005931]|uniref:lipopolysaccharide biosynthesis protein n=1 Tax=Streptomyces sp. NPDC005931 TaxID=3364737 RepID=UPI0036B29CF6
MTSPRSTGTTATEASPGGTDRVHQDTGGPEHGARWVTGAAVAVGVLNYGYALVLTHLLDVEAYAVFGAGQGLVLCASTVAFVGIPWVLAQALARAGSEAEGREAARFTALLGAGAGLVAAAAASSVALQFADPATTVVIALGVLLIFFTTVTVGWLQGTERLRVLACATTAGALCKFSVGLLLVAALGLAETGAVAALGVAVLPLLIWWPYSAVSGAGRRLLRVRAYRDLARTALGITAVQGMVAVVAAVAVVLVTVLPLTSSDAASYQASAMLGRVPLFLAGAISTAYFTALSRRTATTALATNAVRLYLTVALPITAICATAPTAVLTRLFPADYTRMGELVAFAAVSGFAVGVLNLGATFHQAVNDYRCLRGQVLGLAVCVAALVAGWQLGGIVGLAAGSAVGTAAAAALLVLRLVRRYGAGLLGRPPLAEPLLLAGLLIVLRPVPVAWLITATALGARATLRFFRHRGVQRAPAPAASEEPTETDMPPSPDAHDGPAAAASGDAPSADTLLVEAVWTNRRPTADAGRLNRTLVLARRNQVEGRLARAYPGPLGNSLAQTREKTALFRRNLDDVTNLLDSAGIPAVLIKADPAGDYVYDNFDLVVPAGRWQASQRVLAPWYVRRTTYWLERSTKVLLWPPRGPAVHLHTAVSWFGVPVIPTGRLFARAVPCPGHGCLLPGEADALRIWLAHALFQNLTLDMSELLAVRGLLRPDIVARALREAAGEGWETGCRAALDVVTEAVARLDVGVPVPLPLPLPVSASLRVGAEHARHLARRGNLPTAVRELALRGPLVVTKTLRSASP